MDVLCVTNRHADAKRTHCDERSPAAGFNEARVLAFAAMASSDGVKSRRCGDTGCGGASEGIRNARLTSFIPLISSKKTLRQRFADSSSVIQRVVKARFTIVSLAPVSRRRQRRRRNSRGRAFEFLQLPLGPRRHEDVGLIALSDPARADSPASDRVRALGVQQ